jgi:hypothetical protein
MGPPGPDNSLNKLMETTRALPILPQNCLEKPADPCPLFMNPL